MAAFIEDGFTSDGYLNDEPGRHEAVTFQYRPATSREVTLWRTKREREPDKADAEFLANHLVSWDVKKPNGETVEISVANCHRLHPAVSDRLFNIIAGAQESDHAKATAELGNS